jgi:hypothetical protein
VNKGKTSEEKEKTYRLTRKERRVLKKDALLGALAAEIAKNIAGSKYEN